MNKYEISSKKCAYIRLRALCDSAARSPSPGAKPNQCRGKESVHNTF